MRIAVRRWILACGAVLVSCAGARAQSPAGGTDGAPRILDVSLSSDTVALGDRFSLRLTVALPPNGVAFLPDSLEGSDFAPFEPVTWSVEEGVERRVVSVEWPMIAFDVGTVTIPEFAVFTADGAESEQAGIAAPGAAVGSWRGLREGSAALPSTRMLPVGERSLWVASVLVLDENTGSVQPRPAADVVGGDRNWPSTLLMLLFGLTLGSVITVAARDLVTGGWGGRSRSDPRARALSELDVLLADGPHRRAEMRVFYERSSDVVRGFVEEMDDRWNRTWTATELMGGLTARWSDDGTRALAGAIRSAEAVKFGGVRPGVEEAEAYWRTLRDWVAAAPPAAARDTGGSTG